MSYSVIVLRIFPSGIFPPTYPSWCLSAHSICRPLESNQVWRLLPQRIRDLPLVIRPCVVRHRQRVTDPRSSAPPPPSPSPPSPPRPRQARKRGPSRRRPPVFPDAWDIIRTRVNPDIGVRRVRVRDRRRRASTRTNCGTPSSVSAACGMNHDASGVAVSSSVPSLAIPSSAI